MKITNIEKYGKIYLWSFRLIPILFWVYFIFATVAKNTNPKILNNPISIAIFILLFGAYFLLTFDFLPYLIHDKKLKKLNYFLFNAFTVGIGPVLLYWLKIDKDFEKMVKNKNI